METLSRTSPPAVRSEPSLDRVLLEHGQLDQRIVHVRGDQSLNQWRHHTRERTLDTIRHDEIRRPTVAVASGFRTSGERDPPDDLGEHVDRQRIRQVDVVDQEKGPLVPGGIDQEIEPAPDEPAA